jgi:cytochrome c peroxidase
MKTHHLLAVVVLICSVVVVTGCSSTETDPSTPITKAELGKKIFNDVSLSTPSGQSCVSCHSEATGFSDPAHAIVSPGIKPGLFGNRNAPGIGYAQYAPALHYDNVDSTYVGGFFYDGRVNTLEEQAMAPFLNHLEMNNTSVADVVGKLKQASYFRDFISIYGESENNDTLYRHMADAIATFERTNAFAKFTSKYDAYLAGTVSLSEQEMRGLKLFEDTTKAKCANCHITDPDAGSGKVLFTDFTYDNIGVPKNTKNPFYTIPNNENPDGPNAIDLGLGGFLKNHDCDGQFKVPSLRNVELSAPYFHNGFFDKLEDLVHWYNVRDSATLAGGFPQPEISGNVNDEELGNLHLTPQEEADVVAFLKTLTDGYK